VKQLKGFLNWKSLEIGAEFIHGSVSSLKQLIDEQGWPCRLLFTWAQGDGPHTEELKGKEYCMYYFGKDKKLLRWDTEDPDVTK
jgi:hypothetical protein